MDIYTEVPLNTNNMSTIEEEGEEHVIRPQVLISEDPITDCIKCISIFICTTIVVTIIVYTIMKNY